MKKPRSRPSKPGRPREAPAKASRAAWLAAGRALAHAKGADAVTLAALRRRTRGGDASFRRHFGSLADFQAALMAQGLDEVRQQVFEAMAPAPAGPERLALALRTWLDAHRARPWVRALTVRLWGNARAFELVRQRINGFVMILQLELEAVDWPRATTSARLCAAAMFDISLAEFEAGRALPDLRDTMLAYVRRR